MKNSSFTKKKAAIWVASGAAMLGFMVGATTIASAEDAPTADTAIPAVKLETPVEGDAAAQLEAAVQSAAPGATIDRLETDASGHAYEAHITLDDGTHKILFFNENFEFEGEEVPPAGHGPHDGDRDGHQGPRGDETPLEGDIAAQVTAAAEAAAPGATVDRVETDSSGHAYEAHVTLEDGTHKILFFNENFEFEGEEVPPAGHGPHDGDRGGHHGDVENPVDTTTTVN